MQESSDIALLALTLYGAITTFSSTMSMTLSERSRAILRHIVEAYVETGSPVGSRTISRRLGMNLSPATIRNVMADLEEYGLLYAPHTSAGRLPTETGLQLVVNGLLEFGDLTEDERVEIENEMRRERAWTFASSAGGIDVALRPVALCWIGHGAERRLQAQTYRIH